MTNGSSNTTQQFNRPSEPFAVTLKIPYRQPGNAITHVEVRFRIYQENNEISVFPELTSDIRRLVNLPEQIHFKLINGKVETPKHELKELCEEILETINDRQLLKLIYEDNAGR